MDTENNRIGLEDVISAAVDTANAMCNPDKLKFEWDWIEESLVLNCTCLEGYTRENLEDAIGYCQDLSKVVECILRECDDRGWYVHSKVNVWSRNGNEMPDWFGDDELDRVKCVQCQFFNN